MRRTHLLELVPFAKSLKLDKASFMFVMPLPGSELWSVYKHKNKQGIEWENFFYYRIVKGLSDIPEEKLKKLHKKAIWEFYLRPRILLGLIKQVKTFIQLRIIIERIVNIFVLTGPKNRKREIRTFSKPRRIKAF